MGQLDSAIYFTRKAIDAKEPLFNNSEWNFPVYLLATIQTIQGNYKDALGTFKGLFHSPVATFISGIRCKYSAACQLSLKRPGSWILPFIMPTK
jgi:hypothetical protein